MAKIGLGHRGPESRQAVADLRNAGLMSLSTIVVAFNALLLRRLDLRPGEAQASLETAPAGTR